MVGIKDNLLNRNKRLVEIGCERNFVFVKYIKGYLILCKI